jgi:hypothetical protein
LARIKSEIGQRSWTQQANGDYPAQNFAIGPCPAVAIQSCSGIFPLKDPFRIPNASELSAASVSGEETAPLQCRVSLDSIW